LVVPCNDLVGGIVLSEFGLSPGWKPEIFNRAMTMLVHFFLLEALLLENLFCSLGVVFTSGFSVVVPSVSSPRCCLFSLFFSCVCILDIVEYLVVAEARCNWYLHDINIVFLLKIGKK
jgi:hypothetical protein